MSNPDRIDVSEDKEPEGFKMVYEEETGMFLATSYPTNPITFMGKAPQDALYLMSVYIRRMRMELEELTKLARDQVREQSDPA